MKTKDSNKIYDLFIFGYGLKGRSDNIRKAIDKAKKDKKITDKEHEILSKLGYSNDHFMYMKNLEEEKMLEIKELAKKCENEFFNIRFQTRKQGEIDKLITKTPRTKKPTNNTDEVRTNARNARKQANLERAKKIATKSKHFRVKHHTTPDNTAVLSTLQKKLLKRISKASKVFIQELDKTPVKSPKNGLKSNATQRKKNVVKTHHKVTQGKLNLAA